MMEFRQIRYFLEIVHSKSFVAAASRLGLTQPALSSLCIEPTMKILPITDLHSGREFYRRPPRRAGVDRLIAILNEETQPILKQRER